jgi:hypothetical protein
MELMSSLFEEEARALRRYALELVTAKTAELEFLQSEIEP